MCYLVTFQLNSITKFLEVTLTVYEQPCLHGKPLICSYMIWLKG